MSEWVLIECIDGTLWKYNFAGPYTLCEQYYADPDITMWGDSVTEEASQ